MLFLLVNLYLVNTFEYVGVLDEFTRSLVSKDICDDICKLQVSVSYCKLPVSVSYCKLQVTVSYVVTSLWVALANTVPTSRERLE